MIQDYQYEYIKKMIHMISNYLKDTNEDFYDLVGALLGTLDASEIKDPQFIDQWYDYWGRLEMVNAEKTISLNLNSMKKQLEEMNDFLIKKLQEKSENS